MNHVAKYQPHIFPHELAKPSHSFRFQGMARYLREIYAEHGPNPLHSEMRAMRGWHITVVQDALGKACEVPDPGPLLDHVRLIRESLAVSLEAIDLAILHVKACIGDEPQSK